MSGDGKKKKYPVGYRRPPLHTQFRKGQSGNPTGKRRNKKPEPVASVAAVLAEAFNEKVTVREGEKTRTMTTLEALIRATLNAAIQGKPTAIAKIISIAAAAKLIGVAPSAEKMGGVIVVHHGPSEGFKTVEEEIEYQQRPHREPRQR